MYPAPIDEYVRPATVADALAALGRYEEGDAAFIAGGQSLMQAVKARLVRPRCLIDLQAVSGLSGIDVGADGVRIGPMTRYVEIARDQRLSGAHAAVRDAAERIGDRQVRNRGTIGGSLCWNYVAACMPPTAIGLDAELELTAADGDHAQPWRRRILSAAHWRRRERRTRSLPPSPSQRRRGMAAVLTRSGAS